MSNYETIRSAPVVLADEETGITGSGSSVVGGMFTITWTYRTTGTSGINMISWPDTIQDQVEGILQGTGSAEEIRDAVDDVVINHAMDLLMSGKWDNFYNTYSSCISRSY